LPPRPAGSGGKGIRTPDFQLAKLALYQLSYAPALRIAECRLPIFDCKTKKMPVPKIGDRHFLVDVQQRLNCALPSFFLWALVSFDSKVLNGMSVWMIN
jgi:hypothetical protein